MRASAVCGLTVALLLSTTVGASPFQTPTTAGAQILPVEEVFRVEPAEWRQGQLHLRIAIAPGCYLYRDKLKVEAIEPAGYKLGTVHMQAGERIHDEHFGDVRIFRNTLQAHWKPLAKTPPTRLKLTFQGCAEKLVCYPPQTRIIDVLSYP